MNNLTASVFLFLFSVFIASLSQVLLKKSANKTHDNFIKSFLNPLIIIAYGVLFASSFLTMIAYRKVPLSLGLVLESTGYIYILVLGACIFKEKITLRKVIGNLFIIVGILIFAFL